nr:uncharacterized protein LOC111501996 [Leptinotarsa decemlineata]
MPNKSKERRLAIIGLRKKGNFILNSEKQSIKPTRKPKLLGNVNDINYFPCTSCLGYYKKSYLWRHKKNCGAKIDNMGSKTQHLTESQTFLATTGLLGNHLNRSRLKNEVFCIMRPDEISLTAKTDPLICLYGESYLSKHKRKQMHTVTSNKIREMARLKIVLQKSTTIDNLIDVLKPELYENIVAASKIISGFDNETKSFKSSSLALHMGTNLKFLCEVAKKALITKSPLFQPLSDRERDQQLKNINDLRDMLKEHWCNDISSLAQKVLNEKRWEKPKLLPLTEDVKLFNSHISSIANEAYTKLRTKEDITKNYKLLCEAALCLILLFNRKRIGEIQFLDIQTYQRNFSSINQEECLSSLSELEKKMSSSFKRVVVFGKGSKPVPILFTKRMQTYVDLILDIRKETNIVPKSNKYLFANPGSTDRWMTAASVLRKFASSCGARNPGLLTSTKFRKQIATILQLMNFDNAEMEQIARFMGHTEKTHQEFYRLTEDVYQTAKVAKVLLLMNAGKANELKDKNLNEIHIDEEVIDSDEDDRENVPKKGSFEYDQPPDYEETYQSKQISEQNSPKVKLFSVKHSSRSRWESDEKKSVLQFFKTHIENNVAPKKKECLNFIRTHESFKVNDWLRIKTLVYNTYRTK